MKFFTKEYLRNVFAVFVLFLLVYDVSFVKFGVLTTGRFAVIVLVFLYGRGAIKNFFRFLLNDGRIASFTLFVCTYSLVLVLYSDQFDWIIFSRSFWFIVYCLIVPFLIASLCKFDLRIFLWAYFMCAIVQSLFVFVSMLIPEYRFWMQANINLGGNIDIIQSFRSFGLSGAGGSSLSVQLALGFLSGLLFSRSKSESIFQYVLIFIGLIFIFIAEIFVGRTGLLLCIGLLLVFFLTEMKLNFRSSIAMFFAGAFGLFGFNYFAYESLSKTDYDASNIFEWAFSVISMQDDQTAAHLIAQVGQLPRLDWYELILGTGRVANLNGDNFSGSDSGYVQTLYALGLPVSILLYAAIFFLLLLLLRKAVLLNKAFGGFLIAACFVLELKEPFIHKYSIVQFLITAFLLASPFFKYKKI